MTERTQLVKRAGNSIEWLKCTCGEATNLMWRYGTQSNTVGACSLDCAIRVFKGQVKLGFMVDERTHAERAADLTSERVARDFSYALTKILMH